MALYRAQRNLALARDGSHVSVKRGATLDPAWVSEAGLARLLAKGYVTAEDADPGIPLTRIRGIGPERAKGLAAIGLTTVAGLLAATPEAIEQRMSNLTVRQIEEWQRQAHALVEEAAVSDSRRDCGRCG